MLAALTTRVKERTSALSRFLSLCDACEEGVANEGGALYAELPARSIALANRTEDKILRHCATVTHLYGIYETFSESILAFWLTRLPRYRRLSALPEAMRNAYRNGIARIIRDCDRRRYRHLVLVDVLGKYRASLCGESQWEFVAEALTGHERNLRRSEFEKMFHSVGLADVWSFLERRPSLASHTVDGVANKSLEGVILDLVTYRNDATHGSPDEILGPATLREWIEFINVFCEALAEFVMYRIVREEASHNPKSVYGVVTETFRDNVVVVTCDQGCLHVGDQCFFLRESDCTGARIESLQLDGVNHDSVTMEREGVEVGIQTSVRVARNARLIRVDD